MDAFETVFTEQYADVFRFLYALCGDAPLAEEMAQQTFFQAFKHIEGYRGECSLRVWLCQIGKRVYYAHLRRAKRFTPLGALPEEAPGAASPEHALALRDEARQAHRALHALEEPYREVFSLRAMGELPFAQIAELFGKTESWARVTYFRARVKMQEKLKEAES